MKGILYLVATPIGNLEDISYRAIKILKESDIVLAEDTRESKKLFLKYGIASKLLSFNDYSSQSKIDSIITKLKNGSKISLISDAGTPLVSDPGHELVSQTIDEKIRVESIPGPTAVISGLITSGFNNTKFVFEGFLPKKKNELRKLLSEFNYEPRTIIFFESPHRIRNTLKIMIEVLGEKRKVSIAREVTKIHENIIRGSLEEINSIAKQDPNLSRGELVISLEGVAQKHEHFIKDLDHLYFSLREDISLKKFSKIFSKVSNLSSKEIYNKFKEKV